MQMPVISESAVVLSAVFVFTSRFINDVGQYSRKRPAKVQKDIINKQTLKNNKMNKLQKTQITTTKQENTEQADTTLEKLRPWKQ